MRETTVALGIADRGFQEEVLHFLDRTPRVEVVGAGETADALRRMTRDRSPEVLIATPRLLSAIEGPERIAVDLRETVEGLRAAIRTGARGYFVWPRERDALGREISRSGRAEVSGEAEPGRVIAVLGARGGAGATFLATNLAAALARETPTVLADLDVTYGDVTPALGVPANVVLPSIGELVPVSEEITREHLEKVLQQHAAGFRVLHAPTDLGSVNFLEAATATQIVRGLRTHFGAVVLHLPRDLNEGVVAAIEAADFALVVATLDVVGIRAAKRLMERLRSQGLDRRVRLVVNQAGRGEVLPEDAEIVLEAPLACVIRSDRAVARAQNRGELLVGGRGSIARRLRSLASQVLEGRAA